MTALTDSDFEPDQPDRIGYAVGPSFADLGRPSVARSGMAHFAWSPPAGIARGRPTCNRAMAVAP